MALNLNQYVVDKIIEYLEFTECEQCVPFKPPRTCDNHCKTCDFHIKSCWEHSKKYFTLCNYCREFICKNCAVTVIEQEQGWDWHDSYDVEVTSCKQCKKKNKWR